MVKIDFFRTGLDNGWTVSNKNMGNCSANSIVDSWGTPLLLEEDLADTNRVTPQDQFDSWAVHAWTSSEREAEVAKRDGPDAVKLPEKDIAGDGEDNSAVVQSSNSDVNPIFMQEKEQDNQLEEDSAKPAVEQAAQAITDENNAKNCLPWKSRSGSCLQFLAGFAEILVQTKRSLMTAGFRPNVNVESLSFFQAKETSAAEARKKLQRVMHLYSVRARPVQPDGNCQFRALSLQLNGTEDGHAFLRSRIVEHLKKESEQYKDFVLEEYPHYLQRMAKNGAWGDNVTLQAASDVLGKNIWILTDQPGGECVEIRPGKMTSNVTEKPLCLTFLTEIHYDAAELLLEIEPSDKI